MNGMTYFVVFLGLLCSLGFFFRLYEYEMG